jgi:hypothetical protein
MGVELGGSNSGVSKKYDSVAKRSIGVCRIAIEQWDVIVCKLGDVETLYDVWLCKFRLPLYAYISSMIEQLRR